MSSPEEKHDAPRSAWQCLGNLCVRAHARPAAPSLRSPCSFQSRMPFRKSAQSVAGPSDMSWS